MKILATLLGLCCLLTTAWGEVRQDSRERCSPNFARVEIQGDNIINCGIDKETERHLNELLRITQEKLESEKKRALNLEEQLELAQRIVTNHSESLRLSADALRLVDTEPDRSLMLAVEAARRFDGPTARDALRTVIEKTKWLRAFLQGHQFDVADIEFSPDNRYLASVEGSGKHLRIWDLQTLRHDVLIDETDTGGSIRVAGGGYTSVRFVPGGRYVIASNLIDADLVEVSNKNNRIPVSTTAVNPQELQMAQVTSDHVVFNDNRRRSRMFLQFQQEFGESPLEVYFTSNAEYLVARSKRHVRLWSLAGLRPFDFDDPEPHFERRTLTFEVPVNSRITKLDIDPAGRRVAVLTDDSIHVWDLDSERAVAKPLETGRLQLINDIALWPGREDLLVTAGGGGSRTPAAPAIVVWEISTGNSLGTILSSFDRQFVSVAFSPDGRYLAAGNRSSHLMLWDLGSDFPLKRRLGISNVELLTTSPTDQFVAVAQNDGSLVILNRFGGDSYSKFNTPCGGRPTVLRVSPDGTKVLLGTAEGNLCVYDAFSKTQIASKTLPAGVGTAAFTPDESSFLAADRSGRIFRFTDGFTRGTLTLDGEPTSPALRDAPLGMALDPTGRFLLVGGNGITAVDTGNGAIMGTPALGMATWMTFSADGRQLAVLGMGDTNLALVEGQDLADLRDGRATLVPVTRQLKGHSEPVTAAAFSQDGDWIATSALRFTRWNEATVLDEIIHPGDKYEIRLWSNDLDRQVGKAFLANGRITQLSFSTDAKTLYSVYATGEVHAWDLSTEAWIARASDVLGSAN